MESEPTTTPNTNSNAVQSTWYSSVEKCDRNYLVTPSHFSDQKGSRCHRGNCRICKIMNFSSRVLCTTTQNFIVTNKPSQANCETKNVIYCITCNTCKYQYVGETKQKLRGRISQHLYSFTKKAINTYLSSHFFESGHNPNNISIDILDSVQGAFDKQTKIHLHDKEIMWIKILLSSYPFGFNDQIKGFGNISNTSNPLIKPDHPFFVMPFPTHRKSH